MVFEWLKSDHYILVARQKRGRRRTDGRPGRRMREKLGAVYLLISRSCFVVRLDRTSPVAISERVQRSQKHPPERAAMKTMLATEQVAAAESQTAYNLLHDLIALIARSLEIEIRKPLAPNSRRGSMQHHRVV